MKNEKHDAVSQESDIFNSNLQGRLTLPLEKCHGQ